jgi:Ca-activated chloride channel family protein
MISIFDDQNQIVLPLTQKQDGLENKVQEILDSYDADNGTDIQKALSESLDAYTADGKQAIAILFSDGESSVNVKRITDRYLAVNIPVFTVGFSGHSFGGKRLLNSLANKTGGNYYEINNMNSFQSTYNKIVDYKAKRILLDYRTVRERKNILFGTERVLFIVILFTVLGPALGIIFDSEELLKTNTVLRIITGLIAGIMLEAGLSNYVSNTFLCFILCILISLVISKYRAIEYETPQITGYDVNAFTVDKNDFKTGKNNNGSSSTFKSGPNETKEFFATDQNVKRNNKDKSTFR